MWSFKMILFAFYIIFTTSTSNSYPSYKSISQVLGSDVEEICLSYMTEKIKNNKVYNVWPSPPETSWECKDVVLQKLKPNIDDKQTAILLLCNVTLTVEIILYVFKNFVSYSSSCSIILFCI